VDKVRKVLKIAQGADLAGDPPSARKRIRTWGTSSRDKTAVSPIQAVIGLNLERQTEEVLKTLTPREERSLRLRFGIGDGCDHTLEEVGQQFAVTPRAHPADRGQGAPKSCGIRPAARS